MAELNEKAGKGEQRTICEACGNSNLAHDRAVWTDDGSSFCPECVALSAPEEVVFCPNCGWNSAMDGPALPAPDDGLVQKLTAESERLREALEVSRQVLAKLLSAGHNNPPATPEEIDAAFWSVDAALETQEGGK